MHDAGTLRLASDVNRDMARDGGAHNRGCHWAIEGSGRAFRQQGSESYYNCDISIKLLLTQEEWEARSKNLVARAGSSTPPQSGGGGGSK